MNLVYSFSHCISLLCASKIIIDSSLLSLCSFSNLTGYSNSGSKESVNNITNNSNNNTDRDRTLKYPNVSVPLYLIISYV